MAPETATPDKKYTPQDFHSKLMVRWCPGCGDYSILAAVQQVLSKRGKAPHEYAFISGIGCSSRFPLYMGTYGFHTIHGRALAVASGFKAAQPGIETWVITGDGDGFSIGGNHMLHALRRNQDVKILLFNNEIYGLTKGQFSPTSREGLINKSAPMGVIDRPLNPCEIALASGASFVARTSDNDMKHMKVVLEEAANHKGSAFVEIFQNCVIFNDNVHEEYYGMKTRNDAMLYLHDKEPMLYGKSVESGMFQQGLRLVGREVKKDNNQEVYNHKVSDRELAKVLVGLHHPDSPVPMGVIFKENRPTYDELMQKQVTDMKAKKGDGDLQALIRGPKTWKVDAA